MKIFRFSLLVFVCLMCSYTFSQQITIDDTFTPQQLVEENLVLGCVETSNISSQINGSVNGFSSFGYFEKGASNFPFDNGIILSTGRAVSGGNGQNTAVLNEGQSDWLTDPDLETALGITNTLNATSLEFDFVAISNQIQFKYILASEEYFGDFPCNYSDGFAFLIKEAGTNDPYTNIAVIPGTSTPVNTNTIHPEIVGYCAASYPQHFQGYNVMDTNYNGRTKVMSATASISPNVTYHIKLIIADQTDKNYDSAVFIQGNSFNANVNLGEDITTCAENVILDANIQNPSATYEWFLDTNPIAGALQPTLEVTQSGSYTVIISIPLAGSSCTIEDTIEVTLSSTQTANPISDFELCDDPSMDGVEIFDLTTMNDDVLASVPASNYNISYHFTLANAEDYVSPILAPIQNTTNNQIIYVRIEDIDNGCLAYSSFNLVVNPLPNITSPTILIACDDVDADGITQINLSDKNDEITNGQSNLIVTYHYTQADANSGDSPIPQPYVNVSPNEQLFVRVVNPETGCASTTTLSLTVISSPVINHEDLYIDACDQDHDGMATFDLTSVVDEVLQGLTGVNVTFHETAADAQSGSNPIANETNYANTIVEEQTIYIRVEDTTTGCASTTSVEIHSNFLLTATDIRNFSECDEDNDGIEQFNLDIIAEQIINGLEEEGVTITFYTSESNQENEVGALNTGISYTPPSFPAVLYITLNSPTCSEIAEIELVLNPITTFAPIGPVEYCDTDSDGFTSIDLHSFDSQITGGATGFTVRYFASEEDAENNQNALPAFYTNITNPQTIYPRISSVGTQCGDVNSFQISVLPAPITQDLPNIYICDADQDGMTTLDLTQLYTQVVSDVTNLEFAFYDTQAEAEQGINPYNNVNNFVTGSRSVYLVVTNSTSGCYSMEHFDIIVNRLPLFAPISDYRVCELNSDGIGDFIFNTKDAEIRNGQQGKRVLYYRTLEDAENAINNINKNVAYQNTSNPQTIYVRMENTSDANCYATSSFLIEVGTNPLFNEPLSIFKCDDISNDAVELFDLGPKVNEITQGIDENLEVTFYTTPQDAQNNTNPIVDMQFENIVNPQQIYVRIENGTICASFTSFTLNVIQTAQANPAQPLVLCDDDYDGITTFDLTLAEIDILDVRQDNLVISYYRNLEDLDAQTNVISNPTSFTNTSNPQTVFVRITNTLSNCYLAIPLELIVNLPPALNQIGTIDTCDNDTSYYDLSQVDNIIVNNTNNTIISYHATASDALDDVSPLSTDYTYTSNNTTLHIRVENATTGCFITKSFNLRVRPLPNANTPIDLEACDDDFDGLLEFDLSTQTSTILGNQNPANFSVTYHNSLSQAQAGSNILPLTYMAFDTEIIYVRVENNNTGCYSTTQFDIIIHLRPVVDIPDQVLCIDNMPLLVSANTNNPTDTYLWSTNETTPEIDIYTIGSYWVTVTTDFGCETTQIFNVTESEAANIEIVETIDFSDPNNITVTISGIGNYMYQLDDNEPQESNVFQNVGIGYHTITVIDLNGCLEVTKEVLVLDFPQFMTPNDDGYFDTWHIIGVETLPGTVIYIYDRYGKQIHYLTSSTPGWDGMYNGEKMPATDYWFVADVKGGGYNFQAKGHFALKR